MCWGIVLYAIQHFSCLISWQLQGCARVDSHVRFSYFTYSSDFLNQLPLSLHQSATIELLDHVLRIRYIQNRIFSPVRRMEFHIYRFLSGVVEGSANLLTHAHIFFQITEKGGRRGEAQKILNENKYILVSSAFWNEILTSLFVCLLSFRERYIFNTPVVCIVLCARVGGRKGGQ